MSVREPVRDPVDGIMDPELVAEEADLLRAEELLDDEVEAPDDFESVEDFVTYVRKLYTRDMTADEPFRQAALEDAEFVAGKQWEDAVVARRIANKKPVMTINRLPAFVASIIGNRRLNETTIKIIADDDATKPVALVREGLVRSIQKNSSADRAYDKALENSVIGGRGAFQVTLEYASDDVFEQNIRVRAIPNALSVLWDCMSADPTGADAHHCFVIDTMDVDDFKREYPDKMLSDVGLDDVSRAEDWFGMEAIRIVTFWRLRTEPRVLAKMTDNTVQDVTDLDEMELEALLTPPSGEELMAAQQGAEIGVRIAVDESGSPIVREGERTFAESYVMTGAELLEGPYRLPIKRVPVFRVPAWEINVGERKECFGLIRFLKDPQRMHNFWRSTLAERLLGSTSAKWIASDAAIQGYEAQWRGSAHSDDPLLVWNAEAGAAPSPAPAAQLEPALFQLASLSVQDIKDVSNIHEASLGQQSNEVSGRAINARQRVSELSTVIFHDNLTMAIEECGRVINDLIPVVYDTPRVVKALGVDNREEMVAINGYNENALDITAGKYSVSVSTGPSFATKRVEAAESMMAMVNAMPQVMAVAADKIVEAQDWPQADEISRRLRMHLPPGSIAEEDMSPEQLQAQQQAAQQQAQAAELAMAEQMAAIEERRARAAQAQAQAVEAEARAAKTLSEIDVSHQRLALDEFTQTREAQIDTAKALSELSRPSEGEQP